MADDASDAAATATGGPGVATEASRLRARGGRQRQARPLAGDDEDVDVAARADDVVDERAAEPVAPAGMRGLADHELADVALAGEAQHRLADARARDGRRLGPELIGQREGRREVPALRVGERGLARALDPGHDPLGAQPRGQPPRPAHQPAALRVRAGCRRARARPPARSSRSRGRGDSPGRPCRRARRCGAAPARAAPSGSPSGRTDGPHAPPGPARTPCPRPGGAAARRAGGPRTRPRPPRRARGRGASRARRRR